MTRLRFCMVCMHTVLFSSMVGNSSLFRSLLFRSKRATVSDSFSHNSLKRSNCEQIALITLYKGVARANRSLTKSDMSDFARFFEIEYSTLVLSLSKDKQFAK